MYVPVVCDIKYKQYKHIQTIFCWRATCDAQARRGLPELLAIMVDWQFDTPIIPDDSAKTWENTITSQTCAILCGELIYWMLNSDPIYYANHLFVNIYEFIQSDIVRAVLFNLILCERRGFGPTAC